MSINDKKILAICWATIICSSPIIVPQYTNQSSITHVYAVESSNSYTDKYGVTYSFTVNESDNTACLSYYEGVWTELILPSTVFLNGQSYTVTKLGHYFGYQDNDLKSVTIPNTIKSLDDFCFMFADNLSNVKGGSYVLRLGQFSYQDFDILGYLLSQAAENSSRASKAASSVAAV